MIMPVSADPTANCDKVYRKTPCGRVRRVHGRAQAARRIIRAGPHPAALRRVAAADAPKGRGPPSYAYPRGCTVEGTAVGDHPGRQRWRRRDLRRRRRRRPGRRRERRHLRRRSPRNLDFSDDADRSRAGRQPRLTVRRSCRAASARIRRRRCAHRGRRPPRRTPARRSAAPSPRAPGTPGPRARRRRAACR